MTIRMWWLVIALGATAIAWPRTAQAQWRTTGTLPAAWAAGPADRASAWMVGLPSDASAGGAAATRLGTVAAPRASNAWAGVAPADSSHRKGHARIGAYIGGGFGAAVGLIGGAAGSALNDSEDKNAGLKIVASVAICTIVFGLIGAGIGALIP